MPPTTELHSMTPALNGVESRTSLEILHGALVFLSGLASIECAKVPPPIRPGVDLARIQPILAGFELAYHAERPRNWRTDPASKPAS
jgi:hypothetical protein